MAETGNPDVRTIMSAAPVAVAPGTSLLDVVELMRERSIGAVIVAEAGAPVGIFTERDCLQRVAGDTGEWMRVPIREVMTPDPWTIGPETPWQAAFEAMQQRNIRHAPVVEDGMLVGMLSLRDVLRHRAALLESLVQQRTNELVRQQQIVADRDRERTHSLKIAGRIQRHLLPAVAPEFDPLWIAFAFHPQDEVAGDYFDFQLADPNTLILIIGDASGHGVPAAFISVIAKTCVHTRLEDTPSPAALLTAMNDFLYGWVQEGYFISMFVAAIDRRTLRMTYARAGHPLPLHVSAKGGVSELDAGGIMIGVVPDPLFPEQVVQLEPGDRVLFFTDGLPECPNAAQELFGGDRVEQFLVANRRLTPDQVVAGLVESVRNFSANGTFADDLTVVLLEVQDAGAV